MVSKKKKDKAQLADKLTRQHILRAVAVILGVALLVVASGSIYRNEVELRRQAKNLDQAGLRMDALSTELVNKGLDASLTRDEYCERVVVKFSSWTRCAQELSVKSEDPSDEETVRDFRLFVDALNDLGVYRTVSQTELAAFSDRGRINEHFAVSRVTDIRSSCGVSFEALSKNNYYGDGAFYSINLRCGETPVKRAFYGMRE